VRRSTTSRGNDRRFVKILYFADTRFPIERANGVQTMATCHALAARGHDVVLVVRPDTAVPARDPFEYYDWPRLSRLAITSVSGPNHPRARRAQFLFSALRQLARADADVVYTRDLGVAAFLLRIPAVRRPPLVYESHGISSVVSAEMPRLLGDARLAPSDRKLQRLERREHRVWRDASAYMTITRALLEELTSRYGARSRVFVAPDGVRLDAQPAAPEIGGPPTAGYAGHLYPWKGVDVFVHALAVTPAVHGVIVGGHPAESDLGRVQTLVQDLGLASRVRLTGLVRPGDVRTQLARATMLVLPNARTAISERYTSPLKLFEYLAMARPIVASDLPSIREVLTDGRTALLVPPGDPGALAGAMSRLAVDDTLAASLGRASRALAADFTWDRRAERVESALTAAVTA
jgi:glycosyltransferase involved in cell wall biosynthesis